jgi:hypothetical protein
MSEPKQQAYRIAGIAAMLEAGSWRLEAGSWKLDNGGVAERWTIARRNSRKRGTHEESPNSAGQCAG